MSKKLVLAAALGALLSANAMAQATTEGPWLVRVRAVHLNSDNDVNGALTGSGLAINNKWIPELDISYFFTPNIAAELVLTYPQKHTVSLGGAEIGSLKHLPPTLTVQYHFAPTGAARPYVGAGLNFTNFSSVDLPAGLSIDKNSWGFALQAGVDIPVTKNVSLNIDVKKVQIQTDVSAGGANLGTFKVDPILFGVGVGYRF
jgi:outer membrane protein